MDKPKNIQIPYETFLTLLELLEYIDISDYAEDFQMEIQTTLDTLHKKRQSLKRRESYTSFKTSHGDQRDENRIEYLKLKRMNDL